LLHYTMATIVLVGSSGVWCLANSTATFRLTTMTNSIFVMMEAPYGTC
jgi:hypothetical protein